MKALFGMKVRILILLSGLFSLQAQATQIVISNLDGVGEGFNDPTVVAPVGGNPGTTLGQQRLNVFEQAAKIWAAVVGSGVNIVVDAQFNPLTCTSSQGVLGSAGTTSVHGNFTGAPITNTWYPASLANSLTNSDLSANADISATFNSDIDNNNNCLSGTNWYYGLDGNQPGGTIELLSVVLHEVAHGLGFLTLVDIATGAKFNGANDVFMLNLEDHSVGQTWDQLTDAGRLSSAADAPDLHWTGPKVTALIANYTAGVDQGHVRMYAPSTLNTSSSVSHFSNALAPNELMEPFATGPKSGPGLALSLMQDIGWSAFTDATPVITVLGDQSAFDGETIPVTVFIQDNDTSLASLSLGAVSANSAIVAPADLVFSGSGSQRTLSVTPELGSSGNVTITVTVSDAGSSASESFVLNVTQNNPPVVTITSPANNAMVLDTDFVNLQASATDVEDGDVSASLTWASSISGQLGSGPTLVTTLVEGVHTITATATDSLSRTGTTNLTITSYGSSDTDGDSLADNWEFSNFASW